MKTSTRWVIGLGIATTLAVAAFTLTDVAAATPAAAEKVDLSFSGVFPQSILTKSYFNWIVLGLSIIAFGLISYFTFGGGAPAAATGVSTIASAIGGGGAGSYMAGLSAIGSWVGGNAMVGAAVLNGISLGLGGGGAAFATLGAASKVIVLTSISATVLDGVLAYVPQKSTQLTYQVRLAVPDDIGNKQVQNLVRKFKKSDKALAEAAQDVPRATAPKVERDRAETERKRLVTERHNLVAEALNLSTAVLRKDVRKATAIDVQDRLVLGVLCKNSGHSKAGDALINSIPVARAGRNVGYVGYLKAVIDAENGRIASAEKRLEGVRELDPYAIEPNLLLVNFLGQESFQKNSKKIVSIANETANAYDRDEYATQYGILAIRYRIGSQYLANKQCPQAETWFSKAADSLPALQKYFAGTEIRNLVELGVANAKHCQGHVDDANDMVNKILNRAESYEAKQAILAQYRGR